MKKVFILLSIVLMGSFMFSCSNDENEVIPDPIPEPEEKGENIYDRVGCSKERFDSVVVGYGWKAEKYYTINRIDSTCNFYKSSFPDGGLPYTFAIDKDRIHTYLADWMSNHFCRISAYHFDEETSTLNIAGGESLIICNDTIQDGFSFISEHSHAYVVMRRMTDEELEYFRQNYK